MGRAGFGPGLHRRAGGGDGGGRRLLDQRRQFRRALEFALTEPVTVITGFLGAGKTTLLRHLVANAKGRRLALIINEFGERGVDRELLLGDCGDGPCAPGDVIELANGCLCCKVADDFLPTIETLLAREPRPDHIVVETSGLALPKPLVKALAWPEVKARLTVDGVIALVDGPAEIGRAHV